MITNSTNKILAVSFVIITSSGRSRKMPSLHSYKIVDLILWMFRYDCLYLYNNLFDPSHQVMLL